ncbi:conserved hypothetical protein (plasmid) [Borreliella burgdorferi 64b]|nr:conserved hypothetical protein [Borreliella burgdorferi 64b]
MPYYLNVNSSNVQKETILKALLKFFQDRKSIGNNNPKIFN